MPTGIYIRTEKTKKKLSLIRKGKNNPFYGKRHTKKTKEVLKQKHLGRKHSDETKIKMSISQTKRKRKKHSNKTKMLMHNIRIKKIGRNSPNWKGGVSPKNKIIRRSIYYVNWRNKVFKRDNYTCQKCGKKGVYLHPHHIKNFANYSDLRFDVNNGITLCKKCHRKFHSIYGTKNNSNKQLKEFLCKN